MIGNLVTKTLKTELLKGVKAGSLIVNMPPDNAPDAQVMDFATLLGSVAIQGFTAEAKPFAERVARIYLKRWESNDATR